jgi:hypothetical protein
MDDERREAHQQFADDLIDLTEAVDQALEEHAALLFMRETRVKVDDLAVRCRQFLA